MSRGLARSRFVRVAAGAAAGLAISGRARAQSSALTPVRVLIAPGDGETSVVYAKRAGLFERVGLDVQLDKQTNGSAAAAGVVSGAADIGNSSVTSILLAHERGLPFTLIAPAGTYNNALREPTQGALVLKDSPLRFDSDINNQVIGVVSLTGNGRTAFCAYINAHGGDWSSVKFVEIPFAAMAVALTSHRVVAGESVAPQLNGALEGGDFRFVPVYGGIAPMYVVSAWFTTRDFSAKHPDVVRRFSRVVAQAAAYANTHHAETAPDMSAFMGVPLADMQRMARTYEGITLSPSLIQPVIAAEVTYGSLKTAFRAEELIDPNAAT